jgi:hypothetical protein
MLRHSCLWRTIVAFGLAGVVGTAAPTEAAQPQIGNITPLGVQRGVSTVLSIGGSNVDGNPRLIAPFGFRIEPQQAGQAKSDGSNWRINLVVAADTAVGVYSIRIQTDDGVSNPFLLAVGQLPEIGEQEDNSVFEAAQSLAAVPLVVEGQLAGNDVDFFRFHGTKGQMIILDAQCARIGSGVDPTIRLTTAGATRAYVASADDSPGLLTDARLTAVLPEDTDYVVELSDSRYQGTGRAVYRLLIGAVPMAEEIFPLGGRRGETIGLELRGGTFAGLKIAAATLSSMAGTELARPRITTAMLGAAATGGPIYDVESLAALLTTDYPELREPSDPASSPLHASAPVVLNGRIDPAGDEDRFVIASTPGQRMRIKVQASDFGSALDGVVRVLGAGGSALANADDTIIPVAVRAGQQPQSIVLPDPSLDLTVPGGTNEITLAIRDLEGRGGVGFPYRIVVEPLLPDFDLLVNEPQVSVPRGGTATVGVTAVRTGYSGPITLTVADPPPGLSARAGIIAAGQTTGVLSLATMADASFPVSVIKLVGRGQQPEGPFERLASNVVVYAQQAALPICSITQHGLFAAPALATPVTLDTPQSPIEIAHGFSAAIPIKVTRAKGSDASLAITPLPLPPGLSVANVTVGEKATEAKATVTAALAAPLGTLTLGLQAKGKLAGGERTVALPIVTVSIVPPAALELSAPSIEVRPGATFELKGKIVRKGPFDGPVTVKINGLPAGLKAEPVTVGKGAGDFVLKVAALAKAAAATAGAQVALAFQVEKKDYSVPPTPLAVKVLPVK